MDLSICKASISEEIRDEGRVQRGVEDILCRPADPRHRRPRRDPRADHRPRRPRPPEPLVPPGRYRHLRRRTLRRLIGEERETAPGSAAPTAFPALLPGLAPPSTVTAGFRYRTDSQGGLRFVSHPGTVLSRDHPERIRYEAYREGCRPVSEPGRGTGGAGSRTRCAGYARSRGGGQCSTRQPSSSSRAACADGERRNGRRIERSSRPVVSVCAEPRRRYRLTKACTSTSASSMCACRGRSAARRAWVRQRERRSSRCRSAATTLR